MARDGANVTALLALAREGDSQAAAAVIEVIYLTPWGAAQQFLYCYCRVE